MGQSCAKRYAIVVQLSLVMPSRTPATNSASNRTRKTSTVITSMMINRGEIAQPQVQQCPRRRQENIDFPARQGIEGKDALPRDLGMGRDPVVGIGVERGEDHDPLRITAELLGEGGEVAAIGFEGIVVRQDQQQRLAGAQGEHMQDERPGALDQSRETQAAVAFPEAVLQGVEEGSL